MRRNVGCCTRTYGVVWVISNLECNFSTPAPRRFGGGGTRCRSVGHFLSRSGGWGRGGAGVRCWWLPGEEGWCLVSHGWCLTRDLPRIGDGGSSKPTVPISPIILGSYIFMRPRTLQTCSIRPPTMYEHLKRAARIAVASILGGWAVHKWAWIAGGCTEPTAPELARTDQKRSEALSYINTSAIFQPWSVGGVKFLDPKCTFKLRASHGKGRNYSKTSMMRYTGDAIIAMIR